MTEADIVQNLISRLGQSQGERAPRELDPASAPVDGRTPAELLDRLRTLAARVRFYGSNPDHPSGDWSPFFPAGDAKALLAREDGKVPPHLGLLAAFLKLYEHPQGAINRLGSRHMDFQFRRVLGFSAAPAVPDRAHVVVDLKKGAAATEIGTTQEFSAGKDATKVERIYRPVREVVVGQGRVEQRKSVFRGASGAVHFAPNADSSDGLGGALDAARPMWPPFGNDTLPRAWPGFAVASPVLRMAQGKRRIELELELSGLDSAAYTGQGLAGAFTAYVTGPKGWLGPFDPEGILGGSRLTLTVTVPATEAAVVGYDVEVHGQSYATSDPILHLQMRAGGTIAYADLEAITLTTTRLTVDVQGLTMLALENDSGALDPKRAFLPFGAQPVKGSRFMIGCDEALSKQLLSLAIELTWQGAPDDLVTWYANYADVLQFSDGVSARIFFEDRTGQLKDSTLDIMKREDGKTTLTPTAPLAAATTVSAATRIWALQQSGSLLARTFASRFMLQQPLFARRAQSAPEARSGFVTVQLEESFLHAEYRKETILHAMKQDKTVLNEPYTPTVQAISLSYRAQSDEVDVGSTDEASLASLDVQFFHAGCFGQMREHACLRAAAPFVDDTRVHLLPSYPHEGELLLGISGLEAGDSVSLLFQVAEDSADPDLPPQDVQWWVLCDNYWRPLGDTEVTVDTSSDLRQSGVLAVALPAETSTDHTILPTGLVWLRGTIATGSAAACQLVSVAANAVEVQFHDAGNDPKHLATALPAGSITKLKSAPAVVKGVTQPYGSHGGSMAETDAHLRVRAAERLRHRARCITAWDWERMVLDEFPALHRVKCIPHARPGSWLAPGHVLLVVIPDLRNQNAVDRLRPRADTATLDQVAEFVRQRCAMGVQVAVKNPFYQRVRLQFGVAMRRGYAFNFYRQKIHDALVQALTPWAFDATRRIEFGGVLWRSVLLDLVEELPKVELPWVDYVTDFRMSTTYADGTTSGDLAMVRAQTPDAILVSDDTHVITQA